MSHANNMIDRTATSLRPPLSYNLKHCTEVAALFNLLKNKPAVTIPKPGKTTNLLEP